MPSLGLPSYQDPITLSPPLSPQLGICCEVSHRQQIIHGAKLTSFGQLWVEPYRYTHPAGGATELLDNNSNNGNGNGNTNNEHNSNNIEHIILEFDGSVSGVQYDRYGAVWVHGVELLRTTTPEPPGDDYGTISWSVHRDVTDYASVLLLNDERDKNNEEEGGNADVYAAVSIPNVVNEEYTGVIEVNCTLVFYTSKKTTTSTSSSSGRRRQQQRPHVMNLNAQVVKQIQQNKSSSTLWNALSVNIDSIQNHTLKQSDISPDLQLSALPTGVAALSSPTLGRVYLDVYASGHSCEEFYYTNLPTTLNSSSTNSTTNTCGGGPIRLLQVTVDGLIAGVAIPFPTVYTGGINPMLWRPLTGIESFDVVPYRFDLTPFVDRFQNVLTIGEEGTTEGDGEITIGLQVISGEGVTKEDDGSGRPSHDGVWFLDATLILCPEDDDGIDRSHNAPLYDKFSTTIHSQPHASTAVIDHGYNVSLANPYQFSIVASSTTSGDAINITYEVDSFATLLPNGDNDVLFLDDGRSISYGASKQKITTTTSSSPTQQFGHHHDHANTNGCHEKIWLQRVSLSQYSFFANTTDRLDSKTFDFGSNIHWSRERFEEYTSSSSGARTDDDRSGDDPGTTNLQLNVYWINSMTASARYNRSLTDHNGVNIAENYSNETFLVSSIMANSNALNECYKAEASAINGSFIVDGHEKVDGQQYLVFDFHCHLPSESLFCGQELCGLLEFESNFWTKARASKKGGNGESSETLASRHHRAFWCLLLFVGFILILSICKFTVYSENETQEGSLLSRLRLHVSIRRGRDSNTQISPLTAAILSGEGDHFLMT